MLRTTVVLVHCRFFNDSMCPREKQLLRSARSCLLLSGKTSEFYWRSIFLNFPSNQLYLSLFNSHAIVMGGSCVCMSAFKNGTCYLMISRRSLRALFVSFVNVYTKIVNKYRIPWINKYCRYIPQNILNNKNMNLVLTLRVLHLCIWTSFIPAFN